MFLRELQPRDAEPLGAFFESLAADPRAAFFRPHDLTAAYARQLADGVGSRGDRYFLAMEGERILGYGMLRGWDEGYDIPAFGVAVAPDARGKGVGRALVRFGLELAREAGAEQVILKVHPDNLDARHLYESEGFTFDELADDGIQLKGVHLLGAVDLGSDPAEEAMGGTPGLAWRTLKNSVWAIIEFGWPILISLVATPYIVRQLGADAYGVLSIVAVTIGFFGMLDLGIGGAALRAIAQEHERGRTDRIGHILSTVTFFYVAVGLIGGSVVALLTPWLVTSVLKIPPALHAEAQVTFYIAAFGFFVSLVVGAFATVPKAVQRFDLSTRVSVVFGTVSTLLVVTLLYLGLGLRGVVIGQVAVNLVTGIVYYVIAARLVPGLRVMPGLDRELMRDLFSFGGYYLVASLGVQLLYQVDKFLVGSMVSVAAVTFYVVPGNITQKLQQLMGAAGQIIFPVSSALAAKEDHETIKRLYCDATRLIFLLGVSVAVPLVLFASPFLRYWMGERFVGESSTVMVLLGLTYLLLGLTGVSWGIAFGSGSARTNAVFAVAMGVLDIALFVMLTPKFGIVGAAVAYLTAAAVGMPSLAFYVERHNVGLGGLEFLRQFVRPLAAAVLSVGASLVLRRFAVGILPTLALMAFAAALTPALYFALRLAEPRDREMAGMILARVRGA